ncbi:MAG: DUF1553 domain-containing protein [Acidobacteria bacterium]|nr:DUF1553 domain-containing protein [Acidobacteriota bacterium]
MVRTLARYLAAVPFFAISCLYADQPGAKVDFDRDVRPILSDKCFACHGPDEAQRQAGLRLDTKEGAFADRGGYQVIVPGDSAASRIYQRISHEQEVARMPPPEFERKLTEEEIDVIRRWVEQGADWETHWAYLPPQRPTEPRVQNGSWARNPVDHYVLAKLEQEGLKPSPEADKITLLRRLSFDLTGLPPTPEDIDSFLRDDAPDAYEKRVDELLKSSHYGERMAMQWLDLARYADTHGYHIDSHRDMWRWRDWVIDAFNRNMPYDQFTVEQLAGDLLPKPTREQLIATGFNRNHMINFEGGAIPEEYHTEYVIDRLDTTATVWMSMTMGCARCHDHKYDPITQRDFYRFFAFFNAVPEKGLDGQTGNAAPMLQLPTKLERKELKKVEREIVRTKRKLPKPEIDRLERAWRPAALGEIPSATTEALQAYFRFEDGLAESVSGHVGQTPRGEVTYNDGQVGRAVRLSGETHLTFGHEDALGDGPFTVGLWMRADRPFARTLLHKLANADSRQGFELYLSKSEKIGANKRGQILYVRLVHEWPGNAIVLEAAEHLLLNDSYHVTVAYDGSGKAGGVAVYLNGERAAMKVTQDALSGSIANSQPVGIGDRAFSDPFKGDIDELRIYDRVLAAEEVAPLALYEPIRSILAERVPEDPCAKFADQPEEKPGDTVTARKVSKAESRCKSQDGKIRDYYLTYYAPKRYRKAYAELQAQQGREKGLDERIPTTMVMDTMETPRDTFVLGRGDYRNKGEKVAASVPAVLPPLPPNVESDRLGLAKWLVSPTHPLTARVAVNRYWQMYFGTGIVKTSEDFGSQGEAPSHPQLLDWLATEFMGSGWDVKAMQRLIVTSATYRQSSKATEDVLGRDPENRLLARGPRFRLPAEMVRDNALAVSGLLVPKIGGPSVYPYQPLGLWKEMSFGDRFTAQEYAVGSGPDLYRRSMYSFWKRTVPPPALSTFDAPDREKCTVRRARTNTPLQALILMNDPTYVEAARALAERVLKERADDAGRLTLAYLRATAREPSANEKDVLLTLLHQQAEEYRQDPEAADAILSVGEAPYDSALDKQQLAAWTMVASTILNLDETITKE